MKYDIAIIGGGPGGYVSAIKAANYGLKVALIEKERIGGECLNHACIPYKSLLYLTKLITKLGKLASQNVYGGSLNIAGLNNLYCWKDNVVNNLISGLKYILKKRGVEIIYSKALNINKGEITLSSGINITANNIIIATGSIPIELPNVKFDGDSIVTSRELFSKVKRGDSVLIVGGGAVGIEAATILSALGIETYIVECKDRILPFLDHDLSTRILNSIKRRGVKVFTSSIVKEVVKDDKLRVKISSKKGYEYVECNKVLVAIGRRANIDNLGLRKLGLKTKRNGFIWVDKYQRTNISGIYAVGDVTGPPLLAHKAYWEAINAIESIVNGKNIKRPKYFPNVIFSSPEVLSVGISELEAKKRGINYKAFIIPIAAIGYPQITGEKIGFMKVIVSSKGRILGIHIVHEEASTLAGIATLIVNLKLTVNRLRGITYPHPTLSEIFLEAIELISGNPIHITK